MTETLYALAILACPVGMGLMMWLMMRGGKSDHKAPSPDPDPELARLRREVAELRATQEDRHGAPTPVDEHRGS